MASLPRMGIDIGINIDIGGSVFLNVGHSVNSYARLDVGVVGASSDSHLVRWWLFGVFLVYCFNKKIREPDDNVLISFLYLRI